MISLQTGIFILQKKIEKLACCENKEFRVDIYTSWNSCSTSWWDIKSGGTHLRLKVHIKDSICFIHHQEFQSS